MSGFGPKLIAGCLARHGAPVRLGVAVSGGGDSMALLALAREVPGVSLRAVTVDHGLRAAARDEAAVVAALCGRIGVAHDLLHWDGRAARGNLMQAARQARHALIADWARAAGLQAVLLGHTLDDQAETVLMRLARGSGVDGLSGMDEAVFLGGVLWLRPLLTVRRTALRDWLGARGIGWCDDPSNDETKFQRVRARQALSALAPLGVTPEGLAATAARMRRARSALEGQVAQALGAFARDDRGTVLVDRAVLDLPAEIRDRLFAHLLSALANAPHPPRLDGLQRWIASGVQGGATLMGCVLRPEAGGLRVFREARAVEGLSVPSVQVWDGRWRARGGDGVADIRALGEAGLRQLSRQAKAGLHRHWRDAGLPRAALAALPGLWRGERLIAAPPAFWPEDWHIEADPIAAPATGGALSH